MEPVQVNGLPLSLKEVPEEHISTILYNLRKHIPETVHVHEYACMLLKYKRANPDLEIFFWAPGGDYRLGIIFFQLQERSLIGSIYCENEEARKAMETTLMSTTLNLPLRPMTLLSGLTSNSHLAAKPYMDKNSWFDSRGKIYWMPWSTAKELQVHLPEGVEIRELNPEHSDIIDIEWPHSFPGSKQMLERQIRYNFGLGVFRGDDLLSWAIQFYYGGIGAVQTLENEKRKGYGKAVVEAMTKKLGEMQKDVHLNIVEGNETSEAFFKSLGFRFAYDSHWVGKNFNITHTSLS
ncbi:unnamed protein product [Nezara viridula]|uniref:N-acetyltransferase domain-containing protein n=1 Tax=Nezara viridula TaxID=85310 RepID=A0A9P0EI20_NEZVI|nr:unnamed protein product [Nezara viridula]